MSCKWKAFANMFVILFLWLTPTWADDDIDKSKHWEDGKNFVRETLKNFNKGLADSVERSLLPGEEQEKEKAKAKAKAYMKGLGFESAAQEAMLKAPDQLQEIKVDDPFVVYYVRLDNLLSYPDRSELKPEDLLELTKGVIYPIVVQDPVKGEQVQSAVTLLDQAGMKSDKSSWELLEIGSAEEVKLFAEARTQILSEKSEKEINPFVIFIPALSQVLLGIKDSNTFKVKILGPHVGLDEKSSSSDFRPAAEVFKELADNAKNYALPPR